MQVTFNVCDFCGRHARKLTLYKVSVSVRVDDENYLTIHRDWCERCVKEIGIIPLIASYDSTEANGRQDFLNVVGSILTTLADPLIIESREPQC